jgi:hypothetical protein
LAFWFFFVAGIFALLALAPCWVFWLCGFGGMVFLVFWFGFVCLVI